MPRLHRFACFICLALLLLAATAQAAPPVNVLRAQSSAIQAAVRKNLSLVFKPKLVVKDPAGPVFSMSISADERALIAALGDRSLRLWDIDAGREIGVITGHKERIAHVALAPGGKRTASVDAAGIVRVWSGGESLVAAAVPAPENIIRLGFAGAANRLVLGGKDGLLTVRDLDSGRDVLRVKAHSGALLDLAVETGGDACISAGADGLVKRTDLKDGTTLQTYKVPEGAVVALALDVSGKTLAAVTSQGKVFAWNVADGQLVCSASDSGAGFRAVDLDLKQGFVVTGATSGEVKAWNIATGKLVRVLGRHEGPVTYVRIDNAGQNALTASEDGIIRLWSVHSGAQLLSMYSTRSGWAVVDGQGRFDGDGATDTSLEWRDGDNHLPVSNFSAGYYEPGLMAKTRQKSLAPVQSITEGVRMPAKAEVRLAGSRGESAGEVVVHGEDQGGGVADVRLYHNGKLVPAPTGTEAQKKSAAEGSQEMERRYRVELQSGENVLDAVALNGDGVESLPASVRVKGAQAPAAKPRLHILSVGVNIYTDSGMNLRYAVADAEGVRDFFNSAAHTLPFASVQQVLLQDAAATRQGILDMMRKLQNVPQQDVVLIYMAGHGVDLDKEWYFLPHDLPRPEVPLLKKYGIASAELKQELEAISARRVFLAIDACHSGGAVQSLRIFQGMKSLRMLARGVGVHVLAATDRDQLAQEFAQLGHGVFTYSLLRGLSGDASKKKNGTVSVDEAMRFVEKLVPVLCEKLLDYTQYPMAHSRGSDFTLVEGKR